MGRTSSLFSHLRLLPLLLGLNVLGILTNSPHPPQLLVDILPSPLPLLHLRQLIPQLLDLLLHTILLATRADLLKLKAGRIGAQTERERVVVVALQRGAG